MSAATGRPGSSSPPADSQSLTRSRPLQVTADLPENVPPGQVNWQKNASSSFFWDVTAKFIGATAYSAILLAPLSHRNSQEQNNPSGGEKGCVDVKSENGKQVRRPVKNLSGANQDSQASSVFFLTDLIRRNSSLKMIRIGQRNLQAAGSKGRVHHHVHLQHRINCNLKEEKENETGAPPVQSSCTFDD